MGLAEGSEILFFDSKFSGAFLLVLRVWLEAWAAWAGRGGCPGNLVFNSFFSAASPCEARLGGAWGWLRACIGSNSAEKALRASSPHRGFFQGWEARFKKSGPSEGLI